MRVVLDQRGIAAAAADHLLAQGFEQFAFCGYPGVLWSNVRQSQFAEYLSEHGHGAVEYKKPPVRRRFSEATAELDELRHSRELIDWVRNLPRPVGMMTCNDVRARQVLSACNEAGIRVPDEVGVVGVNNDELVCSFCDPPLSGVDQDVRRVGYEAAAMLDRLIAANRARRTPSSPVPSTWPAAAPRTPFSPPIPNCGSWCAIFASMPAKG